MALRPRAQDRLWSAPTDKGNRAHRSLCWYLGAQRNVIQCSQVAPITRSERDDYLPDGVASGARSGDGQEILP